MATSSLLLILSLSISSILLHSAAAGEGSQDLVHSSCVHASYPGICLRTLSSYAPPANTPRDLARAAVKISLCRAQRTTDFLTNLKNWNSKREKNALNDCVVQITDSIDELTKTLSELKHLRRGSEFRWQMSNVETWVSAALTNEDTCLDGFKEIDGNVRSDVKRKVTNVGRVTSNALYLINRLDNQTHRKSVVDP